MVPNIFKTNVLEKFVDIIGILFYTQWRSEVKCCPGPTIKVLPFPPLKFAYKDFKWKFMFRAYLKRLIKHLQNRNQTPTN